MSTQTLYSTQDVAVNKVIRHYGETFEARGVMRSEDRLTIYVSSHSGCNRACRFCHLTQTGQTDMVQADLHCFLMQIREVLHDPMIAQKHAGIAQVNIDFMARGEPLMNDEVLTYPHVLCESIRQLIAAQFPVMPKLRFLISSIVPEQIRGQNITHSDHRAEAVAYWSQVFDRILGVRKNGFDLEFYYSLYSIDRAFRRKWLPRALDIDCVGTALLDRHEGVVIHHALIAGQNDSIRDALRIADWVGHYNLRTRFNLVAYNPYSEQQGVESDESTIEAYLNVLRESEYFTAVNRVTRVGFDVKASCGMFVVPESKSHGFSSDILLD